MATKNVNALNKLLESLKSDEELLKKFITNKVEEPKEEVKEPAKKPASKKPAAKKPAAKKEAK